MRKIFGRRRRTGQEAIMTEAVFYYLEQGKSCFVAGMKDPTDIIRRLSEKGIKVKAVPVFKEHEDDIFETANNVTTLRKKELSGYEIIKLQL